MPRAVSFSPRLSPPLPRPGNALRSSCFVRVVVRLTSVPFASREIIYNGGVVIACLMRASLSPYLLVFVTLGSFYDEPGVARDVGILCAKWPRRISTLCCCDPRILFLVPWLRSPIAAEESGGGGAAVVKRLLLLSFSFVLHEQNSLMPDCNELRAISVKESSRRSEKFDKATY